MHVEFRGQLSDVGSSNQVSSSNPIQVIGLETSALKIGSHLAGPRKPAFLKRGKQFFEKPIFMACLYIAYF